MTIGRVENSSLTLPPAWLSRITAGNRSLGAQPEVRKMLGEPLPQLADMASLPAKIAQMFRKGGLLNRIRRKLATISRHSGGRIVAAHQTVAAVDEDDNIFVGVEFLDSCAGEEAVIAGVLAHEWGHMVSDLPKDMDWSSMSWDDLFALRREEEAGADAYAGRALYQLDYDIEPVVAFLKRLESDRKAAKRIKTQKYFSIETREAILRGAFAAERRIENDARKLLGNPGYRHPSFSKLLAVG